MAPTLNDLSMRIKGATLMGGDDNRARERARGDGDDTSDPGRVIEMLGNQRRRYLWQILESECDGGEAVSLREASRRIAARERGVEPAAVSYDERKSVYTSLTQFHCPKMDDAGLIEFDKRSATVRIDDDHDDEVILQVEPDAAEARTTVLVSIALATPVVLGAWALGLPVFGSLSFEGVCLSLGIGIAMSGFSYLRLARDGYGVSLADALSRLEN